MFAYRIWLKNLCVPRASPILQYHSKSVSASANTAGGRRGESGADREEKEGGVPAC